MSQTSIPAKYLDLFEKRAFAHLATLMPDGSPQVTPVWVDYVDGFVLVNTAGGRQKDRNVRRDRRVSLSIQDPENPYRFVQVRGQVVEVLEEGADAHIDKMSLKYTGNPQYQWRNPAETRLILKIQVESVSG
jgi:PPOX class probable F420-dependent enzyme